VLLDPNPLAGAAWSDPVSSCCLSQRSMPAVAGGRKRRPRCGIHWTADRASDPLHKGVARHLRPIDRPHCVWL